MEMTVKDFRKLCKENNVKLTITTTNFTDLGYGSVKFFKTNDGLKRLFISNEERLDYVASLTLDQRQIYFTDTLMDKKGTTILRA